MVDSQVLKRLDFPAYCIKLLDNGLVALTGGGGTSKTGVGNSIELGFITYSKNYEAEFKQIHKFESEDAIMKFVSFACERPVNHSSSSHNNKDKKQKCNFKPNDLYIAAAVNQTIEIYKIQPNVSKTPAPTDIIKQENNNLMKRKKSSTSQHQNGHSAPTSNLEASASIKLVNLIKLNEDSTDANSNNSDESITTLQVFKSKSSKEQILLCAGTCKGNIVIWSLLFETNNNVTHNKINFEKVHEFKQAHTNEIDDLQVNSEGLLLSIGKDSKCFVWSLSKMRKLSEIDYISGLSNDKNLRIKHARFSQDSDFLYTTYIPRIRGGTKNMSSFIQRWSRVKSDTSKDSAFSYKVDKTVRIKNTILTCIQASKDGYFVSAGDCDGKIYLYDFEFNKLINFKKNHSSVITDLVFYYDKEFDFKNLKNCFDLNKFILTISIDRTLQLYKFINTNLTDRFLFNLNKRLNVNSLAKMINSDFCLISMKFIQLLLVLSLFFLMFCYFFTHIE